MTRQSKIIISILTVLTLLFSYLILDTELESFDKTEEDLILSILSTIGSWLLKLLLASIAVYSIVQLVKNRKFGFFLPLAVCVMSFVSIAVLWQKFETRESSPVTLKAHYDGDINGLTLYLRKNKTYKLDDFAFLGGTIHYGEYKIIGDTILLSKKYPLGRDRDIMSNKLLIGKEFILIKPDSNGFYNDNEYVKLRITTDLR